ncbi:hypothetical protein PPERSA_05084 [Pseudocohnilembus persalinus]|uniref:NAD(P)-binding domain n=1 Tax=Pseudocohnilembus persalinus TaxID=266149 RepID=A0A0V0QW50_PSEPJ|nr:hypothetical protein PPERSA_05084 [Pseudocohnilembus persalinus]|eukprot:KRX06471.1 hypothetical protein PPERSA_05084 [Pseudocohnilembus persalinus]
MIFNLIFLVGLGFLFTKIWEFAQIFLQGSKKKDLQKIYGKGWVLVTGGSDGIGKAFCELLYNQGFSVCVFGRNEEKTKNLCQEIKKPQNQNKIVPIIGDFKNCIRDDEFMKDIEKQLDNAINTENVCMLINNVGMEFTHSQRDKSMEFLKDSISVNLGSQILMTKLVLDKYFKTSEKQKRAIISISSFVGEVIMPYNADYCATKSANDKYSQSLSWELKDENIDVLSLKPFFVTTKMTGFQKKMGAISPKACAQGALNHLGELTTTNGDKAHKLQGFFTRSMPLNFLASKFIGFNKKVINKIKAKEARQKKTE